MYRSPDPDSAMYILSYYNIIIAKNARMVLVTYGANDG